MKATTLLLSSLLLAAASASAQTTTPMGVGGGGSPHVRTSWQMGGATISIEYGRPRLKGRSEDEMMPVGRPWRTGADVATILTTDWPLKFGAVTLQPGRYTINTVPGDTTWQLIFGKLEKAGQWGVPYQPDLEIGRTPMSLTHRKTPVEQVTFAIDHAAGGLALRLEWGTTSVSAPFTIVR